MKYGKIELKTRQGFRLEKEREGGYQIHKMFRQRKTEKNQVVKISNHTLQFGHGEERKKKILR